MLYGKPIKHVRHVDEDTLTIEPQRFEVHTFWKYSNSATARSDGLDLENEKIYPVGSKITKHKMDILITPETIEPQQIYMGRIKLSFHDVLDESISGVLFKETAYQTGGAASNLTTPITPQFFPTNNGTNIIVNGDETANQEIGGSSSGKTITDWLLDDKIKHWINLKKITVFDQRPLMGERFQRVPAKAKRINSGTYYGLFFFNDSVRGGTPADTQVKINIKSYIEELAI